jgi:histidyl-tRNA synthetase
MALTTHPYKGARDFYPEDKRLQNYIFGKLRETCERFGYEEYDAPVLEPTDLYLAKGNQEIIDEQTYTFKDRGDRSVTMRTEMTPTLSRMVAARRQELAYPLRWYSIPNLWRYERPQKGRLREFWQLNADIFGVQGVEADQEIILLADQIMKNLGAKPEVYSIRLNSRKLMDYIFGEYMGLDEVQRASFARLIDRMHKIDRVDFVAQADALCSPSQREQGAVERLLEFLAATHFSELPDEVQHHESIVQLQHLMHMLESSGVSNAVFDPSLMRGFDYYTDIVFEVFDTDPENNRSMFGGGRYDGLVVLFGVEPVATVGFGMGDAVLTEFLKGHGLLPDLQTKTDVYAVVVGEVLERAQKPIQELRNMGLNVAVDLSGRKIGDQFKTADKKGIEYVLIIGEQELNDQQYTLKNLVSGDEEKHGLDRIVSIVLDRRHNHHHDDEEL